MAVSTILEGRVLPFDVGYLPELDRYFFLMAAIGYPARVIRDSPRRLKNMFGAVFFVAVGMLYNHESPLRPPNYLSRRLCLGVAAIKKGEAKELQLGDLSAERDWSDARDIVNGMWLSLQAAKPGDYVFASGQQRTVELVDYAGDRVVFGFRALIQGAL